eukprot:GHVH01007043.1.p2 GENE.GHVH01007043.1~~GHVH01007043.1.p2  ORF type:complete len:103 (+),score=11.02 GHVH01007043.1:509-817(+)
MMPIAICSYDTLMGLLLFLYRDEFKFPPKAFLLLFVACLCQWMVQGVIFSYGVRYIRGLRRCSLWDVIQMKQNFHETIQQSASENSDQIGHVTPWGDHNMNC